MSAESFEAAYLHWLKRPYRTQREPDEPDPKDHGMEPTRHKSGILLDHPDAEGIRKRVHVAWESAIVERAKNYLRQNQGSV